MRVYEAARHLAIKMKMVQAAAGIGIADRSSKPTAADWMEQSLSSGWTLMLMSRRSGL